MNSPVNDIKTVGYNWDCNGVNCIGSVDSIEF